MYFNLVYAQLSFCSSCGWLEFSSLVVTGINPAFSGSSFLRGLGSSPLRFRFLSRVPIWGSACVLAPLQSPMVGVGSSWLEIANAITFNPLHECTSALAAAYAFFHCFSLGCDFASLPTLRQGKGLWVLLSLAWFFILSAGVC